MAFRLTARNFIIGKENYIPSHAIYKSALLRGQLSAVTILVCFLYIFTDWVNGVSGFKIYYLVASAISIAVFVLNRYGYYLIANTIFLATLNGVVYIFASNDHYRAGTYIYFIITALVSVALFGYRSRGFALLFVLISLGLFVFAYVFNIHVVEMPADQVPIVYSESYIRTTFIINFIVALGVSCSILYFLIDVNHWSENEILAKNDLLAKTNQELDRFVYSASHDLKAPLSSMLGLIEIAQRTDDPEEVKACLGMMRERVNNLDEFIREIIDYSRNSRLELKKEKVNLMELMKNVVDGLRYAEGFENIYFKYTIPPDFEIDSDRSRLKVVLNNLIGNSLKYHDSAKDNPLIEVIAKIQNENVLIEVNDNGIGIAEEHQQKIFDMFYRATEKSKGSGLGLYIAKETVEKLGGMISLTSQVNLGTRFLIRLPLA